MKMSKRALRMERHHRRRGTSALNLVALMDIFTILVFFLLVNATEVDVLPNAKMVALPESVAEERPRETVVVMVTEREILVQGRGVIGIDEAMKASSQGIPALSSALESLDQRRVRASDGETGAEVTILGAKDVPYSLLRKIMVAGSEAGYGKISFAVMQKSPGDA
jgi:biopolymer transport protein ExbD